MIGYSRDVQDRAREWVNEQGVEDGAEWDHEFAKACREIAAIDRAADTADERLVARADEGE